MEETAFRFRFRERFPLVDSWEDLQEVEMKNWVIKERLLLDGHWGDEILPSHMGIFFHRPWNKNPRRNQSGFHGMSTVFFFFLRCSAGGHRWVQSFYKKVVTFIWGDIVSIYIFIVNIFWYFCFQTFDFFLGTLRGRCVISGGICKISQFS